MEQLRQQEQLYGVAVWVETNLPSGRKPVELWSNVNDCKQDHSKMFAATFIAIVWFLSVIVHEIFVTEVRTTSTFTFRIDQVRMQIIMQVESPYMTFYMMTKNQTSKRVFNANILCSPK